MHEFHNNLQFDVDVAGVKKLSLLAQMTTTRIEHDDDKDQTGRQNATARKLFHTHASHHTMKQFGQFRTVSELRYSKPHARMQCDAK